MRVSKIKYQPFELILGTLCPKSIKQMSLSSLNDSFSANRSILSIFSNEGRHSKRAAFESQLAG